MNKRDDTKEQNRTKHYSAGVKEGIQNAIDGKQSNILKGFQGINPELLL